MSVKWDEYLNEALEKINVWIKEAVVSLPNILMGIVLFVLFVVAAQIVKRILRRTLARFSDHTQLNRLVSGAVSFAVIGVGLVLALNVMQLEKTVLSLLAGVGVVGLALGFAFQDIAANFMAGLFIIVRRPFHIGDLVTSNDYFGRIEGIRLRNTVLHTLAGQVILIPNKEVFQKPLINYTQSGERRVDLPVGVSYGDDLEKAEQVTLEAIRGIDERDRSREVELFYEAFGDSSVNFTVRFWARSVDQKAYLAAKHAAIKAVHRAYSANGITIPFPIRTLDFGIKGGVRLDQALGVRPFGASKSGG